MVDRFHPGIQNELCTGLYPLESGANTCLLLKPLSLWYFLTAAQAEPNTPGKAIQALWRRTGVEKTLRLSQALQGGWLYRPGGREGNAEVRTWLLPFCKRRILMFVFCIFGMCFSKAGNVNSVSKVLV